ncbi:cobalamin adenosyltransferase [Bacteroidales bacterium]|nr:cobalamin adenosyltransferase [Bacteroidales bacterium]
MTAKSKIYTKGGDKGLTSLVGGKRVSKAACKLEAYGSVDELNSFIGLLIEEIGDEKDRSILLEVQYYLFSVGANLATEPSANKKCPVSTDIIEKIEKEIDEIDAILPKLNHFIMPGGTKAAATAHICRSICRRAERHIYRLEETEEVDDLILAFINRLSDYFFILARKICFSSNCDEIIWKNPCK